MLENLKYLSKEGGFRIYVICEPDETLSQEELGDAVYIPLGVKRGNVSPWEVIKSTYKLFKIFKKEKFTIIQYSTANISLYSCIAGWLARVPIRIYCQWGIDYVDYRGIKRVVYKLMEKITCLLSTRIQPDSNANLIFSLEEGLYKKEKAEVIYNGSACGVDLNKYDITQKNKWKQEIFSRYKIPSNKVVFGYVGRLALEKGINELLQAYLDLNNNESVLMMVGPYYGVDALNQTLFKKAQESNNIIFVGPVKNASKFYATFDFLILPSHREGFGLVVLEAAAMGTPIIVSNIKGPTEFVKDGRNGMYFEVQSVDSLKRTLLKAVSMDMCSRKKLGDNAYSDVCQNYDSQEFKRHFFENRMNLLYDAKILKK